MSMTLSFPSLLHPTTTGYSIHESYRDLCDQTRNCRARFLADWAGKFETYGDGYVQHSPTVLAIESDFADYCMSLAAYALDHPEAGRMLARKNFTPLNRERILFFASVKHDPEKKRWYHSGDMKISASKSKANDRRWEEIPYYADGKPGSIYGLHQHTERGLIPAYAGYDQILEYLGQAGGGYLGVPATFIDLGHSWERAAIGQAFDAMVKVARSYDDARVAKQMVEAFMLNAERRRAEVGAGKVETGHEGVVVDAVVKVEAVEAVETVG